MPTVRINGYSLYYEDRGQGSPVVLGHGLTMDGEMFAHQVEDLARSYRVIVPDWRGHGRSESKPQDYTMEEQAEDLYQLLRHLGVERAHVGGMSMGGMIGLRFALAHPEMTASLILIDTDAGPEDSERAPQYEAMAEVFKSGQGEAVADAVMQILFAPHFLQERPAEVAHWRAKMLKLDPVGVYHATRCVTRRSDVRERLREIAAPALIICGEEDAATTPDKSRYMVEHLPSARLVMVPKAGHTSPLEQPEAVTGAIRQFLAEVG